MAALPPTTDFTGAAVQEGGFKTALSNMRDFLAGLLGTTGTQATALAALGATMGQYATVGSNYTVVAADRGKTFDCAGTLTLTASAASSLGAGFTIGVKNSSVGTVTFDPNGTELVDGVASLTVPPLSSSLFMSTGTGWITVGRAGAALIGVQQFTASGTYTPTPGTTKILVEWKRSGGGGGGAATGGANTAGGGGGGGGEIGRSVVACSTPQAITIGAGGAGGAIGAAGSAGGTSSLGTLLSVSGASGGNPGTGTTGGTGGAGSTDVYANNTSGYAATNGAGTSGGAPGSNGVGVRGMGGYGGNGADSYGARSTAGAGNSGAGQAGTSGYFIIYEFAG